MPTGPVIMLLVMNCIALQHDLRLVALSAAICVVGCFTTVTLLGRITGTRRRAGLWRLAAALVFGCSIWSLHFVAMLAFMPDLSISYDLGLTMASVVVPVAGSLLAFCFCDRRVPRVTRTVAGGLLLGAAISGMHYLGVAAMRLSGFLLFDTTTVVASIVWSIALSALALARFAERARIGRRLEVAAWLATGICGLHFTALSALTLSPGKAVESGAVVLGTVPLAVAVGTATLAILLASLVAVLMEQHLALRSVQELARMRLLSNLSHEVLVIERDGLVLEVNSAGERLLKRGAADLIGQPIASMFSPNSQPAFCRRAQTSPAERRPEEMEIASSVGVRIAVEVSCQPIAYMGRPATAVAMRDLTDRRRDEARIRHLARHDALTDLPNRYTLQERLELALATAARDGAPLAVIYLDFDRFKPVNDLHGHAVGDALLVQASKRIQAQLCGGDMLARIGGDEFVIVATGAPHPDKVAAMARHVIEALSDPFTIEGHRVEIGVSAGIALFPADGDTPDALLRAADTAMYRVKDEGRGAVRFFEATMNAQLQARRTLEQQLARAVEAGEMLLHYQPIVNGVTGDVETFEALIRWQHPTRGIVPPMDFIPLAEETGLIDPIGAWVIDTACADAARWRHSCRVSVNVSPSQFRHGDVCDAVAGALRRHGLQPNRLVVEITESVLMADTGKALATLNRLRELGIRLALDDFGTGFSSLAYLQLFKFDKFKIDKSFVRKLGQSHEALTIVRTIVNLGHNLGLKVTAEGVETPQQLAILRALGCDQIQGFLVARPAPRDDFSDHDRAQARSLFAPEAILLSA